jgi:hypothetical protein
MNTKKKEKLIPHIPLKFEDAISAALQTKPEKKCSMCNGTRWVPIGGRAKIVNEQLQYTKGEPCPKCVKKKKPTK